MSFFFCLCCGILVCHPGIEPRPMAVKTRPPGNSSLQSLLILFISVISVVMSFTDDSLYLNFLFFPLSVAKGL